MKQRILIVGGVAAGASAAAKARRVNEQAEIVVYEKGPYISFANCGLPYYVGEDIQDREALFLQTPEGFRRRFEVEARVEHVVERINRSARTVDVVDLRTGRRFTDRYDKLILAPGAGALVPPLPGIVAENIFTVKTVPDADGIKAFIGKNGPRNAVVVGAGFIGLETAEALAKRGLSVSVVEMAPQVLPVFDPDIAAFVQERLETEGIRVLTGRRVMGFPGNGRATGVALEGGETLPADLVILSIGVRPELELARQAGLQIGEAGGIAVDETQRTSDLDIFAAGDAVETLHLVTGKRTRMPLAGPANKQGRVAGANAAGGALCFPGALGTAIVESMGITAAKTGLSEADAKREGFSYNVIVTHAMDHASYYPGSALLHIKIVAEEGSGRLLGAQVVGERGVDKRIDVLATALSARMRVTDLEHLDLAYAPQFSSAKDPVVMAGFVASNVMRGDVEMITWEELAARRRTNPDMQVIDVRTAAEFEAGHPEGAVLIPVDDLRGRLSELDKERDTAVYCRVGLRGYLAARILTQSGFKSVVNITGGLLSHPK